jgi:hypothetical protein
MTARAFNMVRHRAIVGRYVMTSRPDQRTQIEGRVRLAGKNVEDTRKISETGAHIRGHPEMQQEETGTLKVQVIAAALPFIVRDRNSAVSTLNCSCRSRCRCLIGNGRTTGSIAIWPTRPSEQVKSVASGPPRE